MRPPRRVGLVLAAAAAALGGLVTAPGASADTATITVHLTDAATGQAPTTQVCVEAYTDSFDFANSACADDPSSTGGVVVVDGLTAGSSYFIGIRGTDWVSAYLPDALNIWDGQLYAAPADIDATLQRSTTITGNLTRPDGSPAAGEYVQLYRSDLQQQVGNLVTVQVDGTWIVEGIPAGSYKVQFGFGPDWAHHKTSWDDADIIDAAAGQQVRVDEQLAPPTQVVGHVTDRSGKALANICVYLVDPTEPDGIEGGGSGCTDTAGDYRIDLVLPGSWLVEFADGSGSYAVQFYPDGPRSKAVAISVPASQTTTVNARMRPAAVLQGRAVDERTGAPIADVCPYVSAGRTGGFIRQQGITCSGADGKWRVSGLPGIDTTVDLAPPRDSGYLETWAYGAKTQSVATRFSLDYGRTTTTKDIKLALGGTLTGTVTDAVTHAPLADMWVDADGSFPGRAGPGEGFHVGRTDSQGNYRIPGLPAGTYTPIVYDGDYDGYAPQWSGGVSDPASATKIGVALRSTSTASFALRKAITVTGHVTNADGSLPTMSGDIDAFTYPSIAQIGGGGFWSVGSGEFSVHSLPEGKILLRFTPFDSTGEQPATWYEGAVDSAHASVIITSAASPTDLTAHLR
ncbi:MAG: hypothetical protein QOJ90_1375 [Actinomycetota bacterium]|nr:hypothetical protein [Actinomycetota bacterium]